MDGSSSSKGLPTSGISKRNGGAVEESLVIEMVMTTKATTTENRGPRIGRCMGQGVDLHSTQGLLDVEEIFQPLEPLRDHSESRVEPTSITVVIEGSLSSHQLDCDIYNSTILLSTTSPAYLSPNPFPNSSISESVC